MIEESLDKLMKKATKHNEVPVAALIVNNGKIIAKAYNKKEKTNDIMGHAEIITIKKASKKLKTWNLSDCELYVTIKPCKMCEEIIKESRIKKVYYYSESNYINNAKPSFIKLENSLSKKTEKILKSFFKTLRK